MAQKANAIRSSLDPRRTRRGRPATAAQRHDGVGAAVDVPAHAAAFDAPDSAAALSTTPNPPAARRRSFGMRGLGVVTAVSPPSSNQQRLATGAVLAPASRAGSGDRRRQRCGWCRGCACHPPPAPAGRGGCRHRGGCRKHQEQGNPLGFMPVAAAEWRVRPSQTHSCLSGR